jgi:hypothetical protein
MPPVAIRRGLLRFGRRAGRRHRTPCAAARPRSRSTYPQPGRHAPPRPARGQSVIVSLGIAHGAYRMLRFTSPRVRGEVRIERACARNPGEGDSPHTESLESPPHPNPLPASGERERTAFAAHFNVRQSRYSRHRHPARPSPRSLFHPINDGGSMQHPSAALSIAVRRSRDALN